MELHKSSRILWTLQQEKSPSAHQSALKTTRCRCNMNVWASCGRNPVSWWLQRQRRFVISHQQSLKWPHSFLMSPGIRDVSILTFQPLTCGMCILRRVSSWSLKGRQGCRAHEASPGQAADARHLGLLPPSSELSPKPVTSEGSLSSLV